MSIFSCPLPPRALSACRGPGDGLAWVTQLPPATQPGNNCIRLLPKAADPDEEDLEAGQHGGWGAPELIESTWEEPLLCFHLGGSN